MLKYLRNCGPDSIREGEQDILPGTQRPWKPSPTTFWNEREAYYTLIAISKPIDILIYFLQSMSLLLCFLL